jgi:hypothetical protein
MKKKKAKKKIPKRPKKKVIKKEKKQSKDLISKGLQRLLDRGKKKGQLSYQEINEALPLEVVDAEDIDNMFIAFNEMNIKLVDTSKKDGENGTGLRMLLLILPVRMMVPAKYRVK